MMLLPHNKIMEELIMTNYELFTTTIRSLAQSQGYYLRLAAQLDELDAETKEQLELEINSLPKFNTPVDVVLYLEQ